MPISFPFKFSSEPEYTEAEIVQAIRSGEDMEAKAMTHWVRLQFYYVWKKCVRRSWDYDLAWRAFDDSLETFFLRVLTGRYAEVNWSAFCRKTAERRYWQLYNRRPPLDDLEDASLPEPIRPDHPDRFNALLPLFGQIEWHRSDFHILTIAEWHIDGYSWQEIREKLQTLHGVDVTEPNLRKYWERAKFDVRVLLVKDSWSTIQNAFRTCHSFCNNFLNLRFAGTRADKIKREHPEMAAAIAKQTDKEDFSQAADRQFAACIDCLIKKVTR